MRALDEGRFIAASHFTAWLKGCVLALALMLSGPALADGFTCAKPVDSGTRNTPDELEEIIITGEEVKTEADDLLAWLRLLVGQYTYEGYVDLCGNGNPKDLRTVTGQSDCIVFGSRPNVHCTVNVRWPATKGENGAPVLGGISNLLPAFAVYSLEPRNIPEKQLGRWGLMFMQVDNKGVAEWAAGTLVGGTFTSREPCVGIPGACQKVTRITARPDSNEISMRVDVNVDSRGVLRQTFLLHRQSTVQNPKRSGGSSR